MEVWVLFGTFVFLLLIGTPVAFCLGVASFATVLYLGLPPVVVFQQLNSGVSVFALMAIPFFIFAGELMVRGDIARRLVALAGAMVGHMRGGLGQVNITASVLFGGISGSAAADATAIGGLMIPQMKEKGYSVEYGVNVTVVSSIIALMLPPSHNMIIYSISAGGRLSIADLFTAGIIPGLLLAVSLMVTAWFVARKAGYPTESFPGWAMLGAIFFNAIPGILLIVIIFGGVRSGIFTASESSCIAAVYALLVTTHGLSHHELDQLRRGDKGCRSHHGHGASGDRLRSLLRLALGLSSHSGRAGGTDEGGFGQPDHHPADDQPGPADARHLHGHVAADRDHHADLPAGGHGLRGRSGAFRRHPGAQSRHRALHAAGRDGAVRRLRRGPDIGLGRDPDNLALLRGRAVHAAARHLHPVAFALASIAVPLRVP
jgi:hypothetical protein